jgi:carbon-monoxide dehydrogenase large subunit
MSAKAARYRIGRVEDEALLRGRGRYVDDVPEEGAAAAVFVRSPHAFAEIRRIDTGEAEAQPGVLAVLTSADMEAAGFTTLSRPIPATGRGGAKLVVPPWPALAAGRAVHVGQPVAMVVAETLAQAQDAAELVVVDYEELRPVVDVRDAVKPGAPQVFPEAPGNLAVDWPGVVVDEANERAVAEIIASAPRVARVSLVNQRLVVASMEPRAAMARYDAAADEYVLRCGSQGVWALREGLAPAMGLKREQLRVLSDDVGGGFGMKSGPFPEYPPLLIAARRLGRPVHWTSTRSEAFLSDNHARDMILEAALALDEEGRFLALRVDVLANMGAFLTSAGVLTATGNLGRCLSSVYRIPKIACATRCVFTNTTQTGPYRGAGRPEANYLLERLVDQAARVTGIDRVELRRRNLIPPSAMPYRTALGLAYDSGDFPAVLEKALELADYGGFAQRRKESEARGKRRGIGVSCFLEHAGGVPSEGAALLFPGGGKAVVALGGGASGQGHATVFGKLVADRLGLSPDEVELRQGDTRLNVLGSGTVASRTTMTAGSAVLRAVETVLEKGRKVAAHALEAAEADIGYRDGFFEVTGTDRRLSLFEVAERAADAKRRGEAPDDLDTNLVAETPPSYPNGCHVAEVEVDPETGVVTVVAYAAVDDAGRVLDHLLVEGQVHGALAQGLGQALMEHAVLDRGSGQLLAGSFMDYAMPRADDMPPFAQAMVEVPCTTNPLGVKGVGEAGTTAALAAVMNAVADALPGDAGATLDMPATPHRVWRAFQAHSAAA